MVFKKSLLKCHKKVSKVEKWKRLSVKLSFSSIFYIIGDWNTTSACKGWKEFQPLRLDWYS